MRKQIAGAVIASVLIGSVPGWAQGQSAASTTAAAGDAQRQHFRQSVELAIDRARVGDPAPAASAPIQAVRSLAQLSALERRDLDTRHAALRTDPVARGTGSMVMMLVGTAISLGVTAYFINKAKKDNTIPSMGRP